MRMTTRRWIGSLMIVSLSLGVLCLGPVRAQSPSAGGVFEPLANYVVSGTWTFTNTTTPFVLLGPIAPRYTVTTITGDGAITIATGLVAMTKGSAAAVTLAAPTAAQSGTELIITAGSAFAHVVTATGLIEDGVTGGSKSAITFAAFNGATITLRAYNLKWTVVSKNAITSVS